MKIVLKTVSLILLWGMVVYVIMFVDPESVKDVGIPGSYLPLLAPFFAAVWYTGYLILKVFWSSITIACLLLLALTLGIAGIMNLFLGLIITAIITFVVFLQLHH